ncbi:hypothetical protein [Xylophilus sp. GOD-11R]|uniref:hypothetical protein n=1 Tax=Xylophilus sp. GOD-11R TaxID=3089814 RepID=UPI00298D4DFA|nr:hypothetical protein [Xylophilus sp. GOD-11R]WPB55169.1 hypothetical protein R9X41_13505 [Xylophilus sp. GOD-11R]
MNLGKSASQTPTLIGCRFLKIPAEQTSSILLHSTCFAAISEALDSNTFFKRVSNFFDFRRLPEILIRLSDRPARLPDQPTRLTLQHFQLSLEFYTEFFDPVNQVAEFFSNPAQPHQPPKSPATKASTRLLSTIAAST